MSAPAVSPPSPPLPSRATIGERISAGVLAAACLAVLIIASRLTPSPTGIATHTQLGLMPCGWMLAANMPCPTCGMTTAFANAAHARPLTSLAAQPMGAVLAVATACLFWGSLHVALLGSQLGRIGVRILRPRVLWVVLGLGIAAWVYKIAVVRGWTMSL